MTNFVTQVTKSHVLWDIPVAYRETDIYNPFLPQKGHFREFWQRLPQKEFYVHQMQSWNTTGTWASSAGPQGTLPDNINLHALRLF